MKQILNEWRKFLNEVADPEEGETLDSPVENDTWKFKKEDDKWKTQKIGSDKWIDITSERYLSTLEKLNAAYPTLSVDISDMDQRQTTPTVPTSTTTPTSSAGSIIHEWDVGDEPTLIYVYPGVGYGTQGFVNNVLNGITRTDNTILLIAKTNRTPWSSFKGDGQTALNGKTPSSVRIVGWSGGSIGLADALSSDSFDKIIYADPSPRPLLNTNHQNAVMYYNPSNWKGSLVALGTMQEDRLSPLMNDKAIRTEKNHNEILELSINEIIA